VIVLNILETLISLILIVMIGFFIMIAVPLITLNGIKSRYEPHILRAMIERGIKKSRESGGILVIKKDMILIIEPSKIDKISLKNFKIEKVISSQPSRQIIRFIDGEISLAGSILGKDWKMTVEPVTGRIRVYTTCGVK